MWYRPPEVHPGIAGSPSLPGVPVTEMISLFDQECSQRIQKFHSTLYLLAFGLMQLPEIGIFSFLIMGHSQPVSEFGYAAGEIKLSSC